MNKLNIVINDNFGSNLNDSLAVRPKGKIIILNEKNKIIEESDNMIVYHGREWLLQRAIGVDLDTNNSNTDPETYQAPLFPFKDRIISWFSLGSGGASVADVFVPTVVEATDTILNTAIVINSSPSSDCVSSGYLHPISSIEFKQDPTNNDRYIIGAFTTTIDNDDANGQGYIDINEAGLFLSNTTVKNNYNDNSKSMFAKVTFSTVRKSIDRRLKFIWYIYF